MFELANTSLPNGLIPGTHGFATVAMTKGLPDALRQRLEALCAYTHRQSAHDDRYFRENPVNWFHVALPTGEHAVGRVAACDFDYTGRTNRLARMLVFPAREMPSTGAARVLSAEKARLSAPWEGEPRWLAPGAATATRLASSAAPVGVNPSAWTAKFGADGVALAQRFALLLEKSVRDGGKPIYFKTSAASDHDGTGLLSLFSDLIDLLPPDLRSSVTFSTYPDALPNGTRCHLRGAFDGDRAFAAASALQPWVDCEHGRVMHEDLLPEPKSPPRPTQPETAPSATRASSANGTGAVQSRPQSYFPKPTQSKWLPPEKKNGERTFYLALGSFVAAVIIVFGITMMVMLKKSKKPTTAVEMPPVAVSSDSLSDEKARFEKEKQEQVEREEKKKREDEEKQHIAVEAERKYQEEQEKLNAPKASKSVAPADEIGQSPLKISGETPPKERQGLAFLNATKVDVVDIGRLREASFIEKHNSMMTFYYKQTNCAILEEGEKVKSIKMGFSVEYNPLPASFEEKTEGHFVIFYDSEKNEAFWLWILPTDAKNWVLWFDKSGEHDLKIDVFGRYEPAFEFYKEKIGTPTYTIKQSTPENDVISFSLQQSEDPFASTRLSLAFFEPDNEEKEKARCVKIRDVNNASNKLERVESDVKDFNNTVDDFKSKVKDLKNAIKIEVNYKNKINEESDKNKKRDLEEKRKSAKENVYKVAQEVSGKSKAFGLSVDANVLKNCKNDEDVDEMLRGLKVIKKDANEVRKKFNEDLAKAKTALDNFEADWQEQWREHVRESKFAITKVVGDKEEKRGVR